MGKIFALFFALLINCSCATGGGPWDHGQGDREANANQQLMRQTVMVRQQATTGKIEANQDSEENELLQMIAPPEGTVLKMGGSGFVIQNDGKTSLVMTADHVCNQTDTMTKNTMFGRLEIPITNWKMDVQTVEGQWLPAQIYLEDEEHDVCVIQVAGDAGLVVTLADAPPPYGARLQMAGAPDLEFGKWFCPVLEGIFSGLQGMPDGQVLFATTIPAVGGASGSAVYYHGKVIGVLTRVDRGFADLSYLVMTKYVRSLASEAIAKWHHKNT